MNLNIWDLNIWDLISLDLNIRDINFSDLNFSDLNIWDLNTWDLKVNMMRKFLFMKNVNSSVLISNFDIKLSKTKPFFRYSHLKIKFLH